MKVVGSATLGVERKRLWEAFRPRGSGTDHPRVRAPAGGSGTDVYSMTLTAGVASIKGVYQGQVALVRPPGAGAVRAQGAGAGCTGHGRGDRGRSGSARSRAAPGSTTTPMPSVGGMIGGVGQRMLSSVAKRSGERVLHRRRAAPAVGRGRRGRAAGPPAGRSRSRPLRRRPPPSPPAAPREPPRCSPGRPVGRPPSRLPFLVTGHRVRPRGGRWRSAAPSSAGSSAARGAADACAGRGTGPGGAARAGVGRGSLPPRYRRARPPGAGRWAWGATRAGSPIRVFPGKVFSAVFRARSPARFPGREPDAQERRIFCGRV